MRPPRLRKGAISPRKAPSQGRAKETVEVILRATAHILSREGLAALTTNRVAEKAGVSIGSLYQYFPGKDALITALVEQEATKISGILAEHVGDADAPFQARVRSLVRGLMATHRVDPVLHDVLATFGKQLGSSSPLSMIESASIALVAEQLAREPGLKVKDPALAAYLLYHSVTGILIAVTAERPALLAEGSLLEDELCRFILRYLGHGA
jgi:AcrR family transcriptional regulator